MTSYDKNTVRAWVITLVGALFALYSFFQVNMMGALNGALSKALHASASQIGMISAFSFYANILFMIPAGLLLDRYKVKIIMLVDMILVIIGTLLFAYTDSIYMAAFARFLCGIMIAFGLLACLKLASLMLPPERMAFASSLIITISMLGGILAGRPMSGMIESFGYQNALLGVVFMGVLIFVLLALFLHVPKSNGPTAQAIKTSVWKSLFITIKSPQNWMLGFYICLLNLPVAILGALFGIPYLMQVYHLPIADSAMITSMLFIGMIVGSPIFGWVSDYLKRRKLPMIVGSSLCLLSTLYLLFSMNLSVGMLYMVFFAIGATSAGQVLGYPVISEINPPAITATALSLAAILIMGVGYGLGLPFVGWLLDYFWTQDIVDGIPIYTTIVYQKALLTLPIGILISLIIALFVKETKCQSIHKA